MARILVVDDDQEICAAFEEFLTSEGHTPVFASTAKEALAQLTETAPDLTFMDIRMPGENGLAALEKMRTIDPDAYVVMMTAYGTSQTSIEATRLGAFDYLMKPLDLDELKRVMERALAARTLGRAAASEPAQPVGPAVGLVGHHPAMQAAYKLIGVLATNRAPALITGERGVGKHLIAHTIHDNSADKARPFGALHCRSLPEEQLGPELFGEEAVADGTILSRGRLETLAGGTLFLDDVEVLSLALQARVLQYLQLGDFERAGGHKPIKADVRIIAGTEAMLGDRVREGQFNEGLYHRLRVLSIHVPALRERREDLPELVEHFVQRHSAALGRRIRTVAPPVLELFDDYGWPGNVRELEDVLQRAIALARGEVLTVEDLGDSLQGTYYAGRDETEHELQLATRRSLRQQLSDPARGEDDSPYRNIVDVIETTLVDEMLKVTAGNQLRAARRLGITRATLRKKMGL